MTPERQLLQRLVDCFVFDDRGREVKIAYSTAMQAIDEARELLAQPERKPLTDEQIEAATGARRGTPLWLVAVGFARAIERAHGIAPPEE